MTSRNKYFNGHLKMKKYPSITIKNIKHICENKGADQLRSNREADQRLCFCYIDNTIPHLPMYEISSH